MRIAIIGPVYPYRAGIAYCTTRLAQEMAKWGDVTVISFKRQYPKSLYPGGDDIDETLRQLAPKNARFVLDVVNPLTWLRVGLALRRERYDAVVMAWWVWVWALPYRTILAMLPRSTRVILQCHNIGDKEPSWWKRALTNVVLRRGDVLVVHAATEAADAASRVPGKKIVTTFLPVHELGREVPSRLEAKKRLGISGRNVALFFGHLRPFKALDIALRAWPLLRSKVTLLVAGEAWWKSAEEYRQLARKLGLEFGEGPAASGERDNQRSTENGERSTVNGERSRVNVILHFRFIPDDEVATYFAAADVVLAPYRIEAQSGVALTAFHFGRPVIATTVGGLPEIIDGTNGLLVPPEDPAALAAAIDEFFTSLDRESMERRAADSARKYSWQEYSAVFRRLLAGDV